MALSLDKNPNEINYRDRDYERQRGHSRPCKDSGSFVLVINLYKLLRKVFILRTH